MHTVKVAMLLYRHAVNYWLDGAVLVKCHFHFGSSVHMVNITACQGDMYGCLFVWGFVTFITTVIFSFAFTISASTRYTCMPGQDSWSISDCN